LHVARDAFTQGRPYVQDLHAVERTLTPSDEVTGHEREAQCVSLRQEGESRADPMQQQLAKVRRSVQSGVFVGGEADDVPEDHVDLARWCKRPKGHERRRQGRRHAGVRIVPQGPTLLLALDAHEHHDGPLTVDDLPPYGHSGVPTSPQQALERGKIMRKARSRKKRHDLLADLEKRYLNSP
jgi:hypothetical protein